MNSSHGRVSSRLFHDGNNEEHEEKKVIAPEMVREDKIELKLDISVREVLSKHKEIINGHSVASNINWLHLAENKNPHFTLEELNEQFNILEQLLADEKIFINKELDQLRFAIEQYKLAVMEAALGRFQLIQSLKTILDINQKQIEVTYEFMKFLAIDSEQKHIASVKQYASYLKLAQNFDGAIDRTKERVGILKETRGRKIAQVTLVFFGMTFAAADTVFLAIGFGALALSGPWGWMIIGVTALVGAGFFYVAFNKKIRKKIAPLMLQKDKILASHATYKKDELLSGIQKRLEVKEYIEQLEKDLGGAQQDLQYIQAQKINDRHAMIQALQEKNEDLKQAEIKLQKLQEELGQDNSNLKIKLQALSKKLIATVEKISGSSTELLRAKEELFYMRHELSAMKKNLLAKDLIIETKERENQRLMQLPRRPISPFSPTIDHRSALPSKNSASTFRPTAVLTKSLPPQQMPGQILTNYFR